MGVWVRCGESEVVWSSGVHPKDVENEAFCALADDRVSVTAVRVVVVVS